MIFHRLRYSTTPDMQVIKKTHPMQIYKISCQWHDDQIPWGLKSITRLLSILLGDLQVYVVKLSNVLLWSKSQFLNHTKSQPQLKGLLDKLSRMGSLT